MTDLKENQTHGAMGSPSPKGPENVSFGHPGKNLGTSLQIPWASLETRRTISGNTVSGKAAPASEMLCPDAGGPDLRPSEERG